MLDEELEKLRSLRSRSDELVKWAGKDLKRFLNADNITFVRTADSLRVSKDVNVTTTCSCLMALALCGQEPVVYRSPDTKTKVQEAFDKIVAAPWMSSGLTENNAFTTTLVIRTLGFLRQRNLIPNELWNKAQLKQWYQDLGIVDRKAFIQVVQTHDNEFWKFVWRSLSDKLRYRLKDLDLSNANTDEIRELVRATSLELQRLIEGTWFYTHDRFSRISEDTLNEHRTAYQRAAFNYRLLATTYPQIFGPEKYSLSEVASRLGSDPRNFTINEYAPSAAVIYWFVDGITRANIALKGADWHRLCNWATDEFNYQMALVVSGNEAMMDPVSLAMAACLCARLKIDATNLGAVKSDVERLPSRPELEHSIKELFKHQKNGIWPKYFPLFHYPEGGTNYCFTFELLEAILVEFGQANSTLLEDSSIIRGFEEAVDWCKKNLLKSGETKGWNSGGSLATLEKDEPESWATAVVHMFLWQLQDVLSRRIQYLLLRKYNSWTPEEDSKQLKDLLDVEISRPESVESLIDILRRQIIEPHKDKDEDSLRRQSTKAARSALLFGPPGTSKTQLAKAIAKELGWRLIQIDPSDFLSESLDRIYVQAANVFRDLRDLSGVVILFDEMDALVQTRETERAPETTAQFLTTFMLPKLTELHDGGRVIFFMATNFRDRFDPAITRPGRFDLLLCIGPPSLEEKLKRFAVFTKEKASDSEQSAEAFRKLLEPSPTTALQLQLYTFDEFRGFITSLKTDKSFLESFGLMKSEDVKQRVQADSESVNLKVRELSRLSKINVQIQSIEDLQKCIVERRDIPEDVEVTQVIRYVIDRRVSRIRIL